MSNKLNCGVLSLIRSDAFNAISKTETAARRAFRCMRASHHGQRCSPSFPPRLIVSLSPRCLLLRPPVPILFPQTSCLQLSPPSNQIKLRQMDDGPCHAACRHGRGRSTGRCSGAKTARRGAVVGSRMAEICPISSAIMIAARFEIIFVNLILISQYFARNSYAPSLRPTNKRSEMEGVSL